MEVGFVGLGLMGARMAGNLLRGGHSLAVFNRTPTKAAPLVAEGAREARTPADAARGASVVFTMLSTPQVVTATALGPQGLLAGLASGACWVDCSTVNPSFSRQMAQEASARGVRFLDAPVMGSTGPAGSGKLTFLVGGSAEDLEGVRPLLQLMGTTIRHLGGVGMGSAMKMIVNLQLGTLMAAFAEALALGESLGFSRALLLETLIGGPVAGPFLAGKRGKLERHSYDVEFPLRWQHKDLHLACLTAFESRVAMPLGNAAKEVFMQAEASGRGEEDFSAVAEWGGSRS
jgi:3-hydroxyisobutyrate dehydrogenase-like beta-hydroxyacid dehydrogenase